MVKANKEFKINYTITQRYYMTKCGQQRVCITMKEGRDLLIMEDYPSLAQGGYLKQTLKGIIESTNRDFKERQGTGNKPHCVRYDWSQRFKLRVNIQLLKLKEKFIKMRFF